MLALQSDRLDLRAYRAADAPALFEWMQDPDAMRHTYVAASLEACRARLQRYEAMRVPLGFAPWVIRLRGQDADASAVVGWGGLSMDPDEPHWGLEVSYAFAPRVWGNGYATELTLFSMQWARAALSAVEVNAFAVPDNTASVRVLTKCGFQLIRYERSLARNHYRTTNLSA